MCQHDDDDDDDNACHAGGQQSACFITQPTAAFIDSQSPHQISEYVAASCRCGRQMAVSSCHVILLFSEMTVTLVLTCLCHRVSPVDKF